MLRNALFSLLILLMGKSYAQENFFVLIQTENNQPFYVKMGDKSLSSNAKGRLILSQLKGGSQRIIIGSPQQLFPEQLYTLDIDQKDLEFQLKDLGEKGWGLFNPQTLELKTADKAPPPVSVHNEGIKKDDAFSQLMAGVVGDTAVMYNTYAMEEALKDSPVVKSPPGPDANTIAAQTGSARTDSAGRPDLNMPVASHTTPSSTDTATVATLPSGTHPQITSSPVTAHSAGKSRPPVSTTAYPAGTIDKLSERKTPKGLRIAFADRPTGKKADTVIIIIPLDTTIAKEVALNKRDSGLGQPASSATAPDTTLKLPASTATIPGTGSDSTRTQATAETPLFRTKKPDPVGDARPDSTTPPTTETVVRNNPDTIHVYISSGKKAPGSNTDSTVTRQGLPLNKPDSTTADHTADQKAARGKSDSTLNPSVTGTLPVTGRKTARNKPETTHNPSISTAPDQKTAQNKPDPSSNPPAEAPGRELYRKPDSSQKSAVSKVVVVNSDCRNFASDYDVDKLRVKMLEAAKDEDRILAARKIFKTKCFTTKQIKALSEVFTSDAGKYRFFEAAYPFVSDDHFRELTDLLADPVYNGKFRAMTGQK